MPELHFEELDISVDTSGQQSEVTIRIRGREPERWTLTEKGKRALDDPTTEFEDICPGPEDGPSPEWYRELAAEGMYPPPDE